MSARRVTALAAVVGPALTLAGCGAGGHDAAAPAGNQIRGKRLTIYVAAPLTGASARSGEAVVNGATLALERVHARVGRYRIRLRKLDDVLAGGREWSPAATTRAAQTAAADPRTIAYLGDFSSGASAVSIPILNRLAIAQVSPYSGAVGLTSDGPGSSPGEPQAYYPTQLRTFARVVPSDYVQAQAQVTLQQRLGCTATYVLSDGEYDGDSASEAFVQVAQRRRLRVVATQSYVPSASSYLSVGQTIAGSGADCVLISAISGSNAVKVVTQIGAENPSVRLFATAGLAESSFTDPAQGGVPQGLDRRLLITAPAGDPGPGNASARAFIADYHGHYGGAPEPAAIDGYEAMRLLLSAIGRATDHGRRDAERVRVVQALFATRARASPLGRYRITADGDTSLDDYDIYRVVAGTLHYWKTVRG
jgi:branched-chain amino acid transport system substrate-binding protein